MSFNNPRHRRSRELAQKEVAARMRGRRSALTDPTAAESMKQHLYPMLENIGTLVSTEDRELYYSTAFEILPFGSFNAEACFPASEPPFILLDSGTVDFIGNNCALYTRLRSNVSARPLGTQDVIDYIWASALIYFEKGDDWESRRDAIFAPKLNFSEIAPASVPVAMGYSLAQMLFVVVHEFGHVISRAHGGFAGVTKLDLGKFLGSQFEEGMADMIAFDLLLQFSFGLPEKQHAVNFLSGIDIGLGFIHLMQSAFPVHYNKKNKVIGVAESGDHPIAILRRENFRKWVNEKLSKLDKQLGSTLLAEGKDFDTLMHPYAEAIRNGAEPSENFTMRRELAKEMLA